MNTKSANLIKLSIFACAMISLFAYTAARAQSIYSNAVMSLNPVAYWPLQETTLAPRYDMETNIGSLGPIANAYYYSSQAVATNIGAIAGDSDGSRNFISGGNAGLLVPTTANQVSLSAGQPFTIEIWIRSTQSSSFDGIVNQTGPINSGGLNGGANTAGWSLCQNFAAYRGTGANNSPAVFGFHVFNNNSGTGGGEAEVTNAASGEWLTGATTGYVNSWVYLACVFDGTNCSMYMYSTNLNSAYSGTNAMVYEIPVNSAAGTAYFGIPTPVPNATFTPDTWDPILFAETRNYNGNHNWGGWMDEAAIYTNALTSLQISNHFNAGTNGLGNYKATILGDNPSMYWRMDAPQWTYPPVNTLPPAMNYGSAASAMTNFFTGGQGASSGVYQPGTLPGVAGPSYPGFGSLTNACAFNGMVGAVDAGYNNLLNPTDVTNNFTLVAWFKGNPMDSMGGRTNSLASHSDRSWKADFSNGNTKGYKGVQPQPNIAPGTYNANDGKWHMYVLESGLVNGSTNITIYLDSGLISAAVINTNSIPGTNHLDAWIGGAPDANYTQPTNELTFQSSFQYFAGEITHVAYFTNILTFNQIQNLYFTAQPAPVISQQPVSANISLNSGFTNSVIVQGGQPFYYQWLTNGIAISGATNANFIINPVLTSSGGTYDVVITNAYGAVTSSIVNLTVVSNLVLAGQFPISYTNLITLYGGTNINGTNFLGSTPTFSISALGATPISYQWLTNGVAAGGATNAALTVTNCQLNSPTNFSCVVTNAYGALTSMTWAVSYTPTTTAPFPQLVLAAQPLGYWRLNEAPDNGAGNGGVICKDYESGNNGIYTNVVLANGGYNPTTDPTETSVFFGQVPPDDLVGNIQTNIDFSTPVGGNAEFTVAIWANGFAHAQAANAGLVTKGHWGAEQFTLDEGASANGNLRFVVRDALTGNYWTANSSANLGNDTRWHFIVGICDEANSQLLIYVDGQLAGSGVLAAGSGVLSVGAVPIQIGARDSSTTPGGVQFTGYLNDAAIYNYVLSPAQISSQYLGSGIPPYFLQNLVGSTNLDAGATLVIPGSLSGTPILSYQWTTNGVPISGATNATLVLSNVFWGGNYVLTANNSFGSTNASVSVNAYSGGPLVFNEPQNPFVAVLGGIASNSIVVYGTYPLVYQWQYSNNGSNWVNLANNGRISGTQSSALLIANVQAGDVGNYQVIVTNFYGSITSAPMSTLLIPGVLPVSFYGNTTNGWSSSGSASFANGLLTLTYAPPTTEGNGTFFFQIPQYIGGFEAFFTYQAQYAGSSPLADGITFCLQNDPRGTAATGSGGGDLGYTGIAPSVALQLNIFPGNGLGGMGYAFGINGAISQTAVPGSVSLTNGPVDVTMYYASGQLALTLSNELTDATFSTNLTVGNIPQALGASTAYVGFTGSYGGDQSIQTITNFTFVSIPSQMIQLSGPNAVVSWPGAVVGYTLQQNPSLMTTNWVNVTNAPVLTNSLYQATVPAVTNPDFFRLVLPLQ